MNKNEIVKLRVMQVDDKDVPAKYVEAFNSYLDKVVIPHFEKQLTEKDKEIKMLDLMIKTLPEHDKEMKQLICEKIRDAISQEKLNIEYSDNATKRIINEIICKQFAEDKKSFVALIDRIEEGE